MLKKTFILILLALIISTTFIKNYTKKLDEKIFSVKENINYLSSLKELVKLEHYYLTSPERILELNKLYFDNEYDYTPRKNIQIISKIEEVNTGNTNINE